jgi:FtsZ-binding cell division protein ZapB
LQGNEEQQLDVIYDSIERDMKELKEKMKKWQDKI